MNKEISVVWKSWPADLDDRLYRAIYRGLDGRDRNEPVILFFRADGVGVPGKNFSRLMEIFLRHRMPLNLGVVPSRIHKTGWNALSSLGSEAPELWCWHQNGWRCKNNEPEGPEQEFGPSRAMDVIIDDLEAGWRKMSDVLGDDFYPVFTPPWSRCSGETMLVLSTLVYRAVSRFAGASPKSLKSLPEFPANLDLHTRKAPDSEKDWDRLLEDLKNHISRRYCGILIHHQQMNGAAFDFLDRFLELVSRSVEFRPVNFRDLVENPGLGIR